MKQQQIYNKIMDVMLPRLKMLAENAVYGDCVYNFENIDDAVEEVTKMLKGGVVFREGYKVCSETSGKEIIIKSIDSSLMATTNDGVQYIPDLITTPEEFGNLAKEICKQAKASDKNEYVEHLLTTDELDSDYSDWKQWNECARDGNTAEICNEYGQFTASLYFDKEIGDAWKVFNEDGIFIDNIEYTGQTKRQLSESIKQSLLSQQRI